MDREHFSDEMDRLDLAYSQESNAGKRFIYWQRLNSASDEQFTEVVNRILETERFYPTIATLHGTIERVQQEWRAAYDAAAPTAERFNIAEKLLPVCDTCLDLGWYNVPNPHSNQPSILVKCECGAAIKGTDSRFHRQQHSASMYVIEREHARYPAFRAGDEPPEDAAALAERLRMDRGRA